MDEQLTDIVGEVAGGNTTNKTDSTHIQQTNKHG